MCDTVFEKAKGPSETVNITSDYEKIYKRFYKKDVMRNFTKFPRNHLCQSYFFDKV